MSSITAQHHELSFDDTLYWARVFWSMWVVVAYSIITASTSFIRFAIARQELFFSFCNALARHRFASFRDAFFRCSDCRPVCSLLFCDSSWLLRSFSCCSITFTTFFGGLRIEGVGLSSVAMEADVICWEFAPGKPMDSLAAT
jgi:hypothetical protein